MGGSTKQFHLRRLQKQENVSDKFQTVIGSEFQTTGPEAAKPLSSRRFFTYIQNKIVQDQG